MIKLNLNVGQNIRFFRNEKNISAKTLGEYIGVSPQAILQYERGERNPDINKLKGIATNLQVPIDMLLDNPLEPIVGDDYDIVGFCTKDGTFFETIDDFIKYNTELNSKDKDNLDHGGVDFIHESIVFLLYHINRGDFAENMDNETYTNLLNKVCDLLEFEVFRIEKEKSKIIKYNSIKGIINKKGE